MTINIIFDIRKEPKSIKIIEYTENDYSENKITNSITVLLSDLSIRQRHTLVAFCLQDFKIEMNMNEIVLSR